jgi:hypothetical protein
MLLLIGIPDAREDEEVRKGPKRLIQTRASQVQHCSLWPESSLVQLCTFSSLPWGGTVQMGELWHPVLYVQRHSLGPGPC